MLLIALAFAARCYEFGNPVIDFDEQFYLYVGDRMLHGQLPYVDIWDRKPIGLFLIYAFIRLLGGVGIVQYQIVATLFAGTTAILIWAIVRRSNQQASAILAGAGYLCWLNIYHGMGGQAAVFYNLLTAVMAWAAFRANDCADARRITKLGLLAMAMSGMAIQIKYVPVIEGIFFGGFFRWRLWGSGVAFPRLLGIALLYIVVALTPTLIAIGWYVSIDHWDAFLQANFLSIFHRQPMPPYTRYAQSVYVAVTAAPIAIGLPFALIAQWRTGARRDFILVSGWLIAAAAGFLMLGAFYASYFLPMLLPLWIAFAPLIDSGRRGALISALLCAWSFAMLPFQLQDPRAARAATAELVGILRPYVRTHCMYVYDGPTIAYLLTQACTPTRYVFPDHLSNWTESRALGTDPKLEVQHILASRSGAIITADRPLAMHPNTDTRSLLQNALHRDSVTIAAIQFPDRILYVHVLRALHRGSEPVSDPRADAAG